MKECNSSVLQTGQINFEMGVAFCPFPGCPKQTWDRKLPAKIFFCKKVNFEKISEKYLKTQKKRNFVFKNKETFPVGF